MFPHREDAQWIDETMRGKSAAYGKLVSKYQARLYRSMVLVVGCEDNALDVVQDAFVQAMLTLGTLRRPCHLYIWLYRIAFNLAIETQRWEKRRDRMWETPVWSQPTATARADADDEVEGQRVCDEALRQLRQALARMKEEHRAIVVLREIDGLRYAEIAQILNVSTGTVRSRLHCARLQLLRELRGSWLFEQ
jgi:RNA polymerase sigma-70 factor (ECF subfamily)